MARASLRIFSTIQEYEPLFAKMRGFTLERTEITCDEIWFAEHAPVFTQGQAGKAEHVLNPGDIPVVQSDRGGQITYHGPGQLMIYALCDLKRLNLGIKRFVETLQNSIIALLKNYGVSSQIKCGTPGVFVGEAKICSLGLRVRRGCSYHGMSLNVNMDLSPFQRINPCGFKQLKMVQIRDFVPQIYLGQVIDDLSPILIEHLYASGDIV